MDQRLVSHASKSEDETLGTTRLQREQAGYFLGPTCAVDATSLARVHDTADEIDR
jgi:threonine synthase